MTEMTEFVNFGMIRTFWCLKSWVSDTKRPIVTKVEKPALFGELANNVIFLSDVAAIGFQTKQGFFYGEDWNKWRCTQTNVTNDKTKWNDTTKLKNWTSQEPTKIEGWGPQHPTCHDSGHPPRWSTTAFAVFDIFQLFAFGVNNSCPWQVSMGLSATVFEFCEHPVLCHPDQPYHCTTPTFKGASGSHLCSAPTTLKSTFEAK